MKITVPEHPYVLFMIFFIILHEPYNIRLLLFFIYWYVNVILNWFVYSLFLLFTSSLFSILSLTFRSLKPPIHLTWHWSALITCYPLIKVCVSPLLLKIASYCRIGSMVPPARIIARACFAISAIYVDYIVKNLILALHNAELIDVIYVVGNYFINIIEDYIDGMSLFYFVKIEVELQELTFIKHVRKSMNEFIMDIENGYFVLKWANFWSKFDKLI